MLAHGLRAQGQIHPNCKARPSDASTGEERSRIAWKDSLEARPRLWRRVQASKADWVPEHRCRCKHPQTRRAEQHSPRTGPVIQSPSSPGRLYSSHSLADTARDDLVPPPHNGRLFCAETTNRVPAGWGRSVGLWAFLDIGADGVGIGGAAPGSGRRSAVGADMGPATEVTEATAAYRCERGGTVCVRCVVPSGMHRERF